MTADLINGCFESLGSLFILCSIVKLHRDKAVRGVSWITLTFFLTWGLWNLWYYPHLGQTFSFTGGCLIVLANGVYCAQLLYYGRRKLEEWVYDRPRPRLCTDLIVVRNWHPSDRNEPEVLLVRRDGEPFAGEWCVPGGRVEEREQPEITVERKLRGECGLTLTHAPILFESHGDICDDPRGWFVSLLYIVRVESDAEPVAGETERQVAFFKADELPEMVEGFAPIVRRALRQVRKHKGHER